MDEHTKETIVWLPNEKTLNESRISHRVLWKCTTLLVDSLSLRSIGVDHTKFSWVVIKNTNYFFPPVWVLMMIGRQSGMITSTNGYRDSNRPWLCRPPPGDRPRYNYSYVLCVSRSVNTREPTHRHPYSFPTRWWHRVMSPTYVSTRDPFTPCDVTDDITPCDVIDSDAVDNCTCTARAVVQSIHFTRARVVKKKCFFFWSLSVLLSPLSVTLPSWDQNFLFPPSKKANPHEKSTLKNTVKT